MASSVHDVIPKRVQLRRTKGWRKPEGAIVVSRPGPWGNPTKVGTFGPPEYPIPFTITPEEAVERYRIWVRMTALDVSPLRGYDLACWCPIDQPCHADVLLELANA